MIRSILCLLLFAVPVFSQSVQNTLQDVLRLEHDTREALNHYSFKRDVLLETLDRDGQVTGQYVRYSEFVFDDSGRRIERVIDKHSTMKELKITDQDIQDLADAQMLGLDDAGKYELSMSEGLVEVRPRETPDPRKMSERYFNGRLWLDETGRITRVRGVVEPAGRQRFPWFDTYRANVGASYPFPVKTEADDVLHFPHKDIRYRINVKYYDYRRFRTDVTIKEIEPDSEKISFNTKLSTGRPEVFFTSWPLGSTVQVYSEPGFTPEQREAIERALNAWNVGAVRFEYRGEGQGQVTVRRQNVLALDKKHFAYFQSYISDGQLTAGEIFIDHRAVRPEAIESIVVHEIGHSLGLSDCKDCKSVMRAFPSVNKSNGFVAPTELDLSVLSQRSEIRGQRSEVRGQRSEVRGQRSEIDSCF